MRTPRHDSAATTLVAAFLICAPTAGNADVVETRTLAENLPVDAAAELEVVVDNVFGSVRVTAHDRGTVEMTAVETVRAPTRPDLERARAEVGLRTERGDGRVAFLVRGVGEDCACRCACRWDEYVVAYDIELRVPREASVDVSTVNDGEVVVDGVGGSFRARNVNGPVTLRGLRGAGSAATVNGELAASFERAPAGAASFETVNGEIDVAFPAGLSADLQFETMHGDVWTDFAATPLPTRPVVERRRAGGRAVIRVQRRSAVRVAAGGPTHSFETVNGDIHVRQAR